MAGWLVNAAIYVHKILPYPRCEWQDLRSCLQVPSFFFPHTGLVKGKRTIIGLVKRSLSTGNHCVYLKYRGKLSKCSIHPMLEKQPVVFVPSHAQGPDIHIPLLAARHGYPAAWRCLSICPRGFEMCHPDPSSDKLITWNFKHFSHLSGRYSHSSDLSQTTLVWQLTLLLRRVVQSKTQWHSNVLKLLKLLQKSSQASKADLQLLQIKRLQLKLKNNYLQTPTK